MSAGTHNIASDGLHRLAQAAGLMVHWDDAFGAPHEVNDDILRTLLSAMELPAGSMSLINESLRLLEEERQAQSNSMLIADQGLSFLIPWSGSPAYRVR